jgi:ADP-ribose/FAD diphosphatase
MRFCTQCGAPLVRQVPEGEERERAVCSACRFVHYENPRTVVGCVVEHEGRLLLCRRAIEPGHGLWTTPAGYQEVEEGIVDGARRETLEEADAAVEILAPHALLDVPHIGQSYKLFRARLVDGRYGVGAESLESRLFAPEEIPWERIAFPVVSVALRLYLEDLRAGGPRVHLGVLRWSGRGSRFDAAQYELLDHLAVPLSLLP